MRSEIARDDLMLAADTLAADEFDEVAAFVVRAVGIEAVFVAFSIADGGVFLRFDSMQMQDLLGDVRLKMIAAAASSDDAGALRAVADVWSPLRTCL